MRSATGVMAGEDGLELDDAVGVGLLQGAIEGGVEIGLSIHNALEIVPQGHYFVRRLTVSSLLPLPEAVTPE